MLLGMLGSKHLALPLGGASTGLYLALGLIVLLEINALVGKQGPMTSAATDAMRPLFNVFSTPNVSVAPSLNFTVRCLPLSHRTCVGARWIP